MFVKFIFYLFVLKSAFGFGLRYPGTGETTRKNDYEYNHLLSGWLKLHEEPADWLTARFNCHMEGAFLASPWSRDFTSVIRDLMTNNLLFSQHVNSDMMWSGVHSSFDEGALKFVDGKQVVSLRHDDLVPLERCGVFRAYSTDEALCNIALPYTCYRPGSQAPPSMQIPLPELNSPAEKTTNTDVISKTLKKIISKSTELPLTEPAPSTEAVLIYSSKCGDRSLGYQFAELTGHCYKFHAHAVHTWDLAKSACEEECAYLAIVNSDEEVKVLKQIYAKKIYGAPYPDTAAIGFYKSGRSWKTLEGETIEKAGYAKWRPEAPHFTARLGFIARDGLLYGYTNDVRDVPFICEKPALKQDVNQATEPTETKTVSTEIEKGIVTISDLESVTDDLVTAPTDEAIYSEWTTESVSAEAETDKDIYSEWTTESVSAEAETDKVILSTWNTESVPVAEQTDKAIDSEWNTESVSVATKSDEAILSTWNTESVPVAGVTDEAIKSMWNTESVSVAEQTDEAIDSEWNTESVSVATKSDEAILSTWNTESVPVAGETDEAMKSMWNTESVPVAEQTDEAIDSEWNTESVSVATKSDEAILSTWNTESVPVAREIDDVIAPKLHNIFDEYYPFDYPTDYYFGNARARERFPFEY